MQRDSNRILTSAHKKILQFLPKKIKDSYVLGGDTALSAFYFRHRLSDDLAFFYVEQGEDLPASIIESAIRGTNLKGHFARKIHDRKIFIIEGIKVEFVPLYFMRLEPPTRKNRYGIYVESLKDILANKLIALSDRSEVKDWIDLYYASQKGFGPIEILNYARLKNPVKYEYLIDFDKALIDMESADISFLIVQIEKSKVLQYIKSFKDELKTMKLSELDSVNNPNDLGMSDTDSFEDGP